MKPPPIRTTKLHPQTEINLIRLAYRKRQEAYDYNFADLIRESVPYLITGTVVAAALTFLVAAFMTV